MDVTMETHERLMLADATLDGPPKPILGLLLGLHELADAQAQGVTYHGDPTHLGRIGAHVLSTACRERSYRSTTLQARTRRTAMGDRH